MVKSDQVIVNAMGDIIKNLYEAKTELSSLVERAAKGEEIIIAKNVEPMARLVRYESTKGPSDPTRCIGHSTADNPLHRRLHPHYRPSRLMDTRRPAFR